MRPLLALLLTPALFGAGVVGATAPPKPAAPTTVTLRPVLSSPVAAYLKRAPKPARLGLMVRDLATGQVLEAAQPDELFVPASTMKLLSMAARLTDGGPQSRSRAEVTAPAQEVTRKSSTLSHLTLRGSGDPSFSVTGPYSLAALAQQLAARGVKAVGEVRLAGALDSRTWPALPLGTPVTSFRLTEYPGWNDTPERYDERVISAFEGQLRAAGLQVGGGAGLGRTVGQVAAEQFRAVQVGAPPSPKPDLTEQTLASVAGPPLITLLERTLKPSDNVWAEQLAAHLGLDVAVPATHAAMLAGLRRFVGLAGLNAAPLVLSDASGLSASNRLTPRTLVTVLRRMYDLPFTALKTPVTPAQAFAQRKNLFIEALPRGGTGEASAAARQMGGTLAGRFVGSGLDVRAKTGTLPGVSSLAGYVRGKSGHVLAFALMMDQSSVNTLDLRAYQDKLLGVIAANH